MKKKSLQFARSVAAAALLIPAVVASAAAASKPLARGGDVTVEKAEMAAYLDRVVAGGPGLSADQKKNLLVKLLLRKSLARDGEKRGLGKDPQLEKGLFQWKLENYPDFYWKKEAAKIKVSDKELRALVNPQEKFLLSAIVLGGDEEGRAAAQEIGGLLAIGGDFAKLARERSLGLSAASSGDFGWNTIPSKFVQEKEGKVIRATKVGSYTEPLETQVGWVIYWVRARKSADEVFAEEKEAARSKLLPPRVDAARAAKLAELRAAAAIVYPAEKAIPGAGAPLAVVGGQAIFPETLAVAEAQHDFSFQNVATPKERLEKFIDAFVVVRAMEKAGLDKDPGLRLQFGLERIDLLSQIFLRSEADSRAGVTEADLRAEYQRFYVPEVYALQVIAGTDRARLEEAAAKLEAGESFDDLAGRYNDVRFAKQKGILAAGPIVDFEAEVRSAVERLPDGGVSGVLANGTSGWLIVKRLGKKVMQVPPFAEVATSLRTRLQVKRRAEFVTDYVDRYRERLKISIDDAQLNAL